MRGPEASEGSAGTYVYGDVYDPLRHGLVEQHGLRLSSRVSAQQPAQRGGTHGQRARSHGDSY